jgi:pilus assembly protein Flp/PilA
MALISAFFRDERGHTAIEYCMIAAIVSIAIVASVTSLGITTQSMFQSVAAAYP